ncbi:MAG: site-2 protease family protein [Tepidiformaceae bacterium]
MKNIRLGSLLGIPILVNPSWFLLFGVTTFLLATQVYPDLYERGDSATHVMMAGVSVMLFFASIILHELAHSVVAKAYKIPVRSITLFVFGGVAQITREAAKPMNELLMAIAGPLTSLVLGGAFLGGWFLLGANESRPVDYVLIWLAWMNIILGVFNLLPAFPMDGGRVFRSLVWLITKNYNRATSIAAWSGRGIAWVMMGVGFVGALGTNVFIADNPVGGAWLILIGLFLENAARSSLTQNRMVRALEKYKAGDLMTENPPVVDGAMSVASLARGVLEINPRVTYFVENEGKLAGILSGYQMRAIPEMLWDTTTATEAMIPSVQLHAIAREKLVSEVLLEMETDGLLHMPVVENGRVIGVIARDRILGVLRQAGLISAARA